MRYVLLIYGGGGASTAAGLRAELAVSGELVDGDWLAAPAETRTVRVRGAAQPAVEAAAGPYIDTGEPLAGYLVVDCDTPERAAEVAARVPGCAGVEVRPVGGMDDLPS